MNHPSSLALEAFACGESSDGVASHVESCDACRAFVGRLRSWSDDRGTIAAIDAILAKGAADSPTIQERSSSTGGSSPLTLRRFWVGVSTAIVPLAAAAALFLFFRDSRVRPIEGHTHPEPPTASLATAQPGLREEPTNETRFKGDLQLAIVRDRAGNQVRFASTTLVRSGDRLRLEVALDHEQVIVGGVFGDDGSYLELMPAAVRSAGTHFSERSVRIDAQPTRGLIAVGSPEAMARARATHDFGGLATVRLDVEGSP